MITPILESPVNPIYAAIVVGIRLAAVAPRRKPTPNTLPAVIITLLLYWLAHSYADLAKGRL